MISNDDDDTKKPSSAEAPEIVEDGSPSEVVVNEEVPKSDITLVQKIKQALTDFATNVKKNFSSSVNSTTNEAIIKDSFESIQRGIDKTVDVGISSVNTIVTASISAVGKLKKEKQQKKAADNKDTIYCATDEEALVHIKEWIEEMKINSTQKRPQKWNFTTIPLNCFNNNKTLDDVLVSFCRWAKESDNKINMTRLYDRLTSYAIYMDNTNRDLIDPPLTTNSIKESWKAWGIQLSYNNAGRLVIWFDLSQRMELVKEKISSKEEETLRLFVWFTHFIMFDTQAQTDGCILVLNLGRSKNPFWDSITTLPQLAHKILTIFGTIPVRMKHIYLCESPEWAHVLIGFIMKPFLSQTVNDRILFMENPELLEDIFDTTNIPEKFSGTNGKMEKDILWSTFYDSYEAQQVQLSEGFYRP